MWLGVDLVWWRPPLVHFGTTAAGLAKSFKGRGAGGFPAVHLVHAYLML